MNSIDDPTPHSAKGSENNNKSKTDYDPGVRIRELLSGQNFCILCTQAQDQPYGSLIAYSFTDDLKHLYFTTPKTTRKFSLLQQCRQVAMVIDDRCLHPDNMKQISAVTITGTASQLESGAELATALNKINSRHPYLSGFISSSTTALFRVDVIRYLYVTRFQEVTQWIP